MRTIDTNERALVGYFVDQFRLGAEMQNRALDDLADTLGISPDAALDFLNQGATDQAIVDRLGIETYPAESDLAAEAEAPPSPVGRLEPTTAPLSAVAEAWLLVVGVTLFAFLFLVVAGFWR